MRIPLSQPMFFLRRARQTPPRQIINNNRNTSPVRVVNIAPITLAYPRTPPPYFVGRGEERRSPTGRNCAIVTISLLILSDLLTLLILNQVVRPMEIEEYKTKISNTYMSTQQIITELNVTNNFECKKHSCGCIEYQNTDNTTRRCDISIINQEPGLCDDGAYCCHEVSDTCITNACNSFRCRCSLSRVFAGYDNNNNPHMITIETCTGYKCYSSCYSYSCNHRCIRNVRNRECTVTCGDIYTLDYTYIHVPDKLHILEPKQYDLVKDCVVNNMSCHNVYNDARYKYKNHGRTICTESNVNCASDFPNLMTNARNTRYLNLDTNINLLKQVPENPPEYNDKYAADSEGFILGYIMACSFFVSMGFVVCLMETETWRNLNL